MIQFNNPAIAGPYLPTFFSPDDPRPARQQIDERYIYGGWKPQPGFRLPAIKEIRTHIQFMAYPGDPLFWERARARLRDEWILLFDYDYVAIIQPDLQNFEVARIT